MLKAKRTCFVFPSLGIILVLFFLHGTNGASPNGTTSESKASTPLQQKSLRRPVALNAVNPFFMEQKNRS